MSRTLQDRAARIAHCETMMGPALAHDGEDVDEWGGYAVGTTWGSAWQNEMDTAQAEGFTRSQLDGAVCDAHHLAQIRREDRLTITASNIRANIRASNRSR